MSRTRGWALAPTGSLAGLLVGLVVALVLLTLAVGAQWSPLLALDRDVARAAYDVTYRHRASTHAWLLVSTWGGPPLVRAAMVSGAIALAVGRRFALATWLVALVVVEAVVAPASKQLLDRPRPSWTHPITTVAGSSYPSGHATAAATAAGAAVIVALHLRRTSDPRRPPSASALAAAALAVLAVLGAALIAASRVFLGVHYLSDVCGGALLGAILAAATWLPLSRSPRRPRPWRPAVPPR